jgi:hypothetical protein
MFKAPPIDLGEDQEPSSFAEASEDREIGNQPLYGARDRKSEESKGD